MLSFLDWRLLIFSENCRCTPSAVSIHTHASEIAPDFAKKWHFGVVLAFGLLSCGVVVVVVAAACGNALARFCTFL